MYASLCNRVCDAVDDNNVVSDQNVFYEGFCMKEWLMDFENVKGYNVLSFISSED